MARIGVSTAWHGFCLYSAGVMLLVVVAMMWMVEAQNVRIEGMEKGKMGVRRKENGLPPPWDSMGETPQDVQCHRSKDGKCRRGSVIVSDWQQNAIYVQQNLLQRDKQITQMQLGSTHNSHIDYADGYGNNQRQVTELLQLFSNEALQISNQWLTITDQLNTGVRVIELDVHWIGGDLRICHAGGIHLKNLDKLIHWIEKETNKTIHFDSETIGCFSSESPTLSDAIGELQQWLEAHPEEILIVMLDDQEDIKEWGFVDLMIKEISRINSLLLTPERKKQHFGDAWPTWSELLKIDKRIIINSRTNYGPEMYRLLFPRSDMWEEHGQSSFKPFPECLPSSPTNKTIRITSSALWYAMFQKDDDWISPEKLSQMMLCDNINYISAELITPNLMKGLIWSFKEGHPKTMEGCLMLTMGGWQVQDCQTKKRVACRLKTNRMTWRLSDQSHLPGEKTGVCIDGWEAGIPRSGQENQYLKMVAGSEEVWLNGRLTKGSLEPSF